MKILIAQANLFFQINSVQQIYLAKAISDLVLDELLDIWMAYADDAERFMRPFPDCLYDDRQRKPIAFDFDIQRAMAELYPATTTYALTPDEVSRQSDAFDSLPEVA